MSKKHKRKQRGKDRYQSSTAKGPVSSTKTTIQSNGLEICPCCGTKMSLDKELSGLMYCVPCSLFFWIPTKKTSNPSLSTVFSAVKRHGGTDILFSDRIPGLVSSILPDTKEGTLEILRRLSDPTTQGLVDAIRKDDELSEIEISLFISKSGLDRQGVIEVCNALRISLNRKVLSQTLNSTLHSRYIFTLIASVTEAFPEEKVKIQWSAVEDPEITYVLTTGNVSEKVKSMDSLWLTIHAHEDITLRALYKKRNEIESRTVSVRLASPPVIHYLSSEATLPAMETEKLRIRWKVEHADKVTLTHRYNDYEKLTMDVTDRDGELSFTAARTEILELVAERRNILIKKSLMIDVIPLPKVKVSEIPQLVEYPDLDISRITNMISSYRTDELLDTVREISSVSELNPYRSLRENISDLGRLIFKLIK